MAIALGFTVGIVVAVALAATNVPPFGIDPGFVGLVLNATIFDGVTLVRTSIEPAVAGA